MGVWRSHHSVGNMVGSLMASAFVEYDWGLSFAVPSLIIVGLGLVVFLLLAAQPATVGCPDPDDENVWPILIYMSIRIAIFFSTFVWRKKTNNA